ATVLIVDDAKVMRVNLRNMLEKLGHEVVAEAETGYQGIKMYEEHLPDLVTMDITMPSDRGIADGIDAVAGIKDFHPAAKVIMVTSHGEQDKVIKAIQKGASNYLLKPIQIEKLEEVIDKVMNPPKK
ncbi:MAG: response regulator, partial [Campylobacterales bacterium]|nr:response regulator [Campylobacterales bacterium]